MKNYKKVYRDHFKISPSDVILCKVCGSVAVDIHHIDPKGAGGSKTKDNIGNLIALCRKCHNKAHGIEQPKLSKEELKKLTKL